ncbi:hypothetical protein GCM10010421_10200 [Streptomyces glaucus]|uniref:Transposase IS204/IS1001/IS1096/IS1165 DDE domain-containing protein n=1 Tax=Streptomyces glaucus TaxID=284029 RepID=A0ABN3J9Z3_9ACTN
MVLRLRIRRFMCEDASCGRRTLVEQITGLTRRHRQRTERMRSALAEAGLAVAGRAGARLADVFGARASRNTVLRPVDALPEPQPRTPWVVGVDEYAMREGRVHGAVLVDAGTRRPVDLLPDREAGTAAAWPAERPGTEAVCRDRAPFFAEGAGMGAPTAVQVAGRFHLRRNLGEAAERCIFRHRSGPRATTTETAPERTEGQAPADGGSPWPAGHRFADRTRVKHATVHAFERMITELQGGRLPQWTEAVRADDLPSLPAFANGLERDLAVVTAGLTLPWSSGVVERHVDRIKMLKRQRYGRAGFALLRRRGLLAS